MITSLQTTTKRSTVYISPWYFCWSRISAAAGTGPSQPQGRLPGRRLEGGPCSPPLGWRGAHALTETGPVGSGQREAGWRHSDACRDGPDKEVEYIYRYI